MTVHRRHLARDEHRRPRAERFPPAAYRADVSLFAHARAVSARFANHNPNPVNNATSASKIHVVVLFRFTCLTT